MHSSKWNLKKIFIKYFLFNRNFFDQEKLQEHIKKYQEKTDNETWERQSMSEQTHCERC